MGLNKKALKLAAYKRRKKDGEVIFGRRTLLSVDHTYADTPSVLVTDVQRVRVAAGSWKYGKYPRCKPGFRDVILSANLLTNVMPKSADPIVKEVDADTNELTIEFTAIKTGSDSLNVVLSEGITASQWSSMHSQQPSALRQALNRMHIADVSNALDKIRGN